MGGDLRSLDAILANPKGLSEAELNRFRGERVLGAAAILLHQTGDAEAATIATDVTTSYLIMWETGEPP
ncbi:hypothetical protein ABZ746_01995 [Streptomyces sp. NPDC020096]